jgi:hypothetical protein
MNTYHKSMNISCSAYSAKSTLAENLGLRKGERHGTTASRVRRSLLLRAATAIVYFISHCAHFKLRIQSCNGMFGLPHGIGD